MPSYLVAEEGPLLGLVVSFEEGTEWILGRDPEVSYELLEDPMVSRKHAICRLTDAGYLLENLSAINPASVNGKTLESPIVLQEGDLVQIGNIFFRFTFEKPTPKDSPLEEEEEESSSTIYEEPDHLDSLMFSGSLHGRWLIKVISGPNSGGEFSLSEGTNYIIGKDPNTCDIVFQDLSVSRQHAKIFAQNDGTVEIEDLGSLNKVLINGQEMTGRSSLHSQDLIALGTTSFLVIDQQQTRETIISPSALLDYSSPVSDKKEEDVEEELKQGDWKKMVIPTRHLIIAGVCGVALILGFCGVFTLFRSESVTMVTIDESQEVAKTLKHFPEVEFSFNSRNGKLFVLGHVMTEIDHQEMIYALKSLVFIQSIEDNVIIDELVWENTNALLTKNTAWRGVNLSSMIPGHFILRGYVQSTEDAIKLSEYINIHFPYLDKLENQVVVENTLEAQIEGILIQNQFGNVTFQLSNGELVLSGKVPSNEESKFQTTIGDLRKVKGIRTIKNFVVLSRPTSDIIDLSERYQVTGSSQYGNVNQYVVINGKILSVHGKLDGMTITQMENNAIFLEKDGIKYKINYNQH